MKKFKQIETSFQEMKKRFSAFAFVFLTCWLLSFTAKAQVFCIGSSLAGNITGYTNSYQPMPSVAAGQAYYWTTTLAAGVPYTWSNCPAEGGTSSDTYLRIYNAANTLVASADDICGANAMVSYTPAVGGLYYVHLAQYSCGTLSTSQVIAYRAVLPPTIVSFTPASGCPGTSVVITGTNFTGASAVTFGGTPAASFVVNSPTQITAITGAGTTGTIAVVNGGTATSVGIHTINASPAAPTLVTATPSTICAGASSNLNATSAGNTISWFTAPSGGVAIGTSASGVNFSVTPAVTTIYYSETTPPPVAPGSQVFAYTGAAQTFTVPAGVTSVTIDAKGAQGAGGNGGNGGTAVGTLAVVPGQVLNIYVGGQTAAVNAAAFNGGGIGHAVNARNGGGASDVRVGGIALANRVIVAGGGGSSSGDANSPGGTGGGGTAVGLNFVGGGGGLGYGGAGGAGGTNGGTGNVSTHSGGAGGGGLNSGGSPSCNTGYGNTCGTAGTLGVGGNGDLWENGICYNSYGGTSGGGGGYYGGGGTSVGNCGGGGGGGGSSWTGSLTSPSFTAGNRAGNGQVTISWAGATVCPSATRTSVTVVVTPVAAAPSPVTATPAVICPGGTSQLNSTGAALSTQTWYTQLSGGVAIGTSVSGVDFAVTPAGTTTYYVETFSNIPGGTQTFNYTGGVQTFTVPAGVTTLTVDAFGAQGGNNNVPSIGGLGGRMQSTVTVVPGAVLNIYVGGAGAVGINGGGYNGGGASSNNSFSGSGGGASDIRVSPYALANRLVVAGGGGGAGYNCASNAEGGGVGGGLTGGTGFQCGVQNGGYEGLGGSQLAGGLMGNNQGQGCGQNGALGLGGNGACTYGGGGGGGYYGGGGGGYGGGGGGSSFSSGAILTNTQGVRVGNGQVIITWAGSVTCPSAPRVAVTVTVDPLPAVTASASPATICAGAPSVLTGGGANTYLWNPGALTGSPTVTPAITTTYTVTGTSVAGCTSNTTVTVTVNPSPGIPVATATPASICAGGTAVLAASGIPLGNVTVFSESFLNNGQGWTLGTEYAIGSAVAGGQTDPGFDHTPTGDNGVAGAVLGGNITTTLHPFYYLTSPVINLSGLTTATFEYWRWLTADYTPYMQHTIDVWNGVGWVNVFATGGPPETQDLAWNLQSINITSYINAAFQVRFGHTIGSGGAFNRGGWNIDDITITGTQPVAVLWTGPAVIANPALATTNVTPGVSGALTYTVTVTGAGGCTSSNTTTLTVNASPTVTASASPVAICPGGSSVLTGGGAVTYAWNPGALVGSPTVTPGATTTYSVIGTDANGCTGATTVDVTVYTSPVITASASPAAICPGGSSVLTGSGGATYAWNPGALVGSPTVTPLATTTYSLVGTDANGCTGATTVDVTVYTSPVITASASPAAICPGGSSVLTGSGGATYAWDPGALVGSPTVTPVATTTYSVVGTDANGCTGATTVDVVVNLNPVVTASASPATICEGLTSMLMGSGAATYLWNPGALVGMPTVTPLATTTYSVTGTDGNGCTGTTEVTVTVLAAPIVTATATPSTTCNLTSVTPIGGGAATYAWTGGVFNNVPFIATATTTYTVTGTDGFGCDGTTTVMVTVNPMSGLLAPATTSQTQVHGDDFNINYYDISCDLIATVDDGAGGNVLGSTISTVTVDATAGNHNGQPFVRRWYQITPTSIGGADVILYFNQSDFTDYNAAVALPYLPLPTSGNNLDPNIGNIRITKNADAGLGNLPIVITPSSVNWNGTYWELTFNTPGFSQFRVHSVNANNAPLPASVTNFSGLKLESSDKLSWTTSSEQNNAYFNLQHSTDGTNFTTLARVDSKAPNGNSAVSINYSSINTQPNLGHNYYRLQNVDVDSKVSVHAEIVDLIWGANGSTVSIYPNPTTDILNIDLYVSKAQNTTVKLLDMSGRVIKQIQAKSAVGMNNIKLSMGEIASGVYTIQVYENNNLTHTSKVKKND